jgi:hypothetical protein
MGLMAVEMAMGLEMPMGFELTLSIPKAFKIES